MKKVYFDSAATTKIREEVIVKMSDVMTTVYGNPSSSHSFGRSSKTLVETARKTIAKQLNVSESEIVFTSGGTEADNLVLLSVVKNLGVKRIITSKIEHHAVLHTVDFLVETEGVSVEYVKLDKHGVVDYSDLQRLLNASEKQTLVSLMHINNEIGSILDLKRTAELCKLNNALFHSDTVQSIGHYELDLKAIPIDFLACSGHKFHGPKGVGFVFIRKHSGLHAMIHGGEQERGLRAGTEAVHNIVGLETAFKLAYQNLIEERDAVIELKRYFISELELAFPEATFNGDSSNLEHSAYTMLNVCFPFDASKTQLLLFQLDLKGIACSRGSACQSGSQKGSHVLAEILNEADFKKPSLRFSFSHYNTKDEVDYVIEALKAFSTTANKN
ncbi:cysteine desulfurase [Formosa agariphila KMM 3901]|uniref:cysteine desulfurase n=1 Tax=Formosa agariphila (strain DSM 15362 / KCTC 12365 / LMG 23005 / KMM 3901 / M-2Alg 35-1) TaxID=1347342 RepID=T2KL32_FORAG|nr:cysteine desulfurase family protein [Formosa agariphila]CDF79146.1 cysteine desulfurase [Formosa agariphila KMM 3901]